ncbi:MAG: hypothetical protein IT175_12435 [Acidobacteria bacterium]|nr:hypothetical protein [Acidobacteriota bacterium]
MPLDPVRSYDEPGYPTLESDRDARRAFLRSLGLAAIAAAFGPVAGCDRLGGGVAAGNQNAKNAGPGSTSKPPDPPPTAGTPIPPQWPGPKAALVGGGPIPVTFTGAEKGWVALAVTFDPTDVALEDRLIGLETQIAEATRRRLANESRSVLSDAAKRSVVEDALFATLEDLAKTDKLEAVTLVEVTEEAVRVSKAVGRPPQAPAPAPSAAASEAPSAAAAPAPPARRMLPRAGEKCAIHPNGCDASEARATGK